MKERLNYHNTLWAVFFSVFLAFGCVSGEKGSPDLPETVEVDLQVGISNASQSLQTKASKNDKDALDGEQINSLVVFIVNASNTVEKKFKPDLSTDPDAQTGELESWTSGTFTLTKGTKQIYAFANWESLNDAALNTAIGTEEGQQMPDLLSKTVSWTSNSFDPDNNKFLPMSFSETWTVSSGKKTIRLIRLVSRLKVTVKNETEHGITINNLEIKPFNTSSHLFDKGEDNILPTAGDGWSIKSILQNQTLSADDTQKASSDWIYINESKEDKGFEVVLATTSTGNFSHADNQHSGSKRTSFVKRIPRNHIWNLNLVFASYELTLGIKGENPPIGGYPDVTTNIDGDKSLVCGIIGGGPFTITIKGLKSLEENKELNVNDLTWSIDNSKVNNDDGLLVGDLSIKGTEITGRMIGAATDTQTATFILEVRNPDAKRTLSFTVTLKFVDIFKQP